MAQPSNRRQPQANFRQIPTSTLSQVPAEVDPRGATDATECEPLFCPSWPSRSSGDSHCRYAGRRSGGSGGPGVPGAGPSGNMHVHAYLPGPLAVGLGQPCKRSSGRVSRLLPHTAVKVLTATCQISAFPTVPPSPRDPWINGRAVLVVPVAPSKARQARAASCFVGARVPGSELYAVLRLALPPGQHAAGVRAPT